jgi:hypothetical protein
MLGWRTGLQPIIIDQITNLDGKIDEILGRLLPKA